MTAALLLRDTNKYTGATKVALASLGLFEIMHVLSHSFHLSTTLPHTLSVHIAGYLMSLSLGYLLFKKFGYPTSLWITIIAISIIVDIYMSRRQGVAMVFTGLLVMALLTLAYLSKLGSIQRNTLYKLYIGIGALFTCFVLEGAYNTILKQHYFHVFIEFLGMYLFMLLKKFIVAI